MRIVYQATAQVTGAAVHLDTCTCPLLFCQDLGSEYAREQWALETLSHHFLPLIRYRRQKARSAGHSFDPELSSPIRL
jgi:hypothetical protein